MNNRLALLTILCLGTSVTLVNSHSQDSHIRNPDSSNVVNRRKAQIINIGEETQNIYGAQFTGLHDDSEFIGDDDSDTTPLTEEQEHNDRVRMNYYNNKAGISREQQIPSPGSITIDVRFHLFIDRDRRGETARVTDSTLEEELDLVNVDFGATPFRFRLADVTRTYDNDWNGIDGSNSDDIDEAAKEMREGGSDVMNIFVTDGLCDAGLGGFAQYPYEHGWYPAGTFSEKDRVFLCPIVLLGSSRTVTHEIGHWMGLRHTFEGDSCDSGNSGDMVDDTSQHLHRGRDCDDERKDTCPGQSGRDPIYNYMNYSACRLEFTPGQVKRMVFQFNEYRRRIFDCDDDETLAEYTVKFDQNPENFDIAYAQYVREGGELDRNWSTLKENRDEGNDAWNRGFRNQRFTREICMPNQNMFVFHVVDSDENGFDDGGFMEIKVGGETLEFNQDTNGQEWFSTFIIADKCDDDQTLFQLELQPNQGFSALSWRLVNDGGGTAIDRDDTEEFAEEAWRKLYHQKCVDIGESYTFTIYDQDGNGIPGYYELKLGGEVIKSGGRFGDDENTSFDVRGAVSTSTPPPTRPPTRPPTPQPTPDIEQAPPKPLLPASFDFNAWLAALMQSVADQLASDSDD